MSFPWEDKVFIIAEAGVNHNGDVELAKKLIDTAAEAKADAVKFQTWHPGELTGKYTMKTSYMNSSTPADESRADLSNRLCLPYKVFRELQDYAKNKDILFLSTPDGFKSLDFLSDDLKIPYIKVGSSELNHLKFLEAVGKKKKPIFLSTGLGTIEEVEKAINTIQKVNNVAEIVILQCTSEYPAPDIDMNIRTLESMNDKFGLPSGLSDHSLGIEAGIAAVAFGACVIEKHFTLDNNMDGPDHQASMNPNELKAFVNAINRTSVMLGDGKKRRMPSEEKNLISIRRSVVAKRYLQSGTTLKKDMLICKRPAIGFEPFKLETLVGKKLKCDVNEDQPIEPKMII